MHKDKPVTNDSGSEGKELPGVSATLGAGRIAHLDAELKAMKVRRIALIYV